MSDTTSTAPIETPKADAPPPVEAKPEAPKAPPETPAKPDWAKFTAAERQARKRAEQIESERKALAAERESFAAERKARQERDALLERAKGGDWEAREALLNETGVTYDELTKRTLNARKGGVDSASEKTARELAELKAQLEQERKAAAERAESETWAATVAGFRQYVTKEAVADFPVLSGEVEADPDLIDSTLRSMDRLARESGTPITLRDAALKMERYFREQTERRAARLRPKGDGASATPSTQTSEQTKPRDQRGRFERGDGPRKLTNDLSAERSGAPKGKAEPPRKLTLREKDELERERIRRGASALR